MPPTKLNPRRKKQKTTKASASSSRQRELLSDKQYAKERKKQLLTREFLNHKFLDWDLLREYGMEEKIRALVSDKTWFKLFAIKEPAYKDVSIEFLSTMMVENDGITHTLTFQAYEEVHTIDLKQIGLILGFYDNADEVEGLPNSFPKGMTDTQYWFQLIKPKTDDFIPSKALSTTFADMEPKLLHHILAHTLCCKKTSHSKVTSFDMLYLFSLITGYKIDLGVELANFWDRQVTDTRTRVIMCGGYITAFLKGMNLFRPPVGDEGIPCKKISAGPFRTWGLTKAPMQVNPTAEAEAHHIPPTEVASTSQPPSDSANQLLRDDLKEIKEEIHKEKEKNRKERKKNKKFRTTLFQMLKSAFCSSTSTDVTEFQYQTSSGEDSTTETDS